MSVDSFISKAAMMALTTSCEASGGAKKRKSHDGNGDRASLDAYADREKSGV